MVNIESLTQNAKGNKMTDFDKLINRCSMLTSMNAHTDAYLAGMEGLNMTNDLPKMLEIKADCERAGYLPPELEYPRHVLYEKMMRHAKAQLTPEQFQQFYMAF